MDVVDKCLEQLAGLQENVCHYLPDDGIVGIGPWLGVAQPDVDVDFKCIAEDVFLWVEAVRGVELYSVERD